MADIKYKLINEETLTDIADAIREKKDVETTYKPSEMPQAISSIDTKKHTEATVTPTEASQTVTPTSPYNGFNRVTVNPIPSEYKKLTTTTTAVSSNILNGKTAYNNNGQLVTGNMANNGSTGGTISTKSGTVTIPAGYTSGGSVSINSTEQAKIVAGNIKQGVTILGVTGTASGGGTPVLQEKTATPNTTTQQIRPDSNYDGLSKVTVNPIPSQYKPLTTTTTATAGNILYNKTAYNSSGSLMTGSMPNNGSTGGTISTKAGSITIPSGYTSGGSVSISSTEQEKIITGNIKSGVTILGVNGKASVVDTSDSNAAAQNLLANKTAYVNGSKVTGTMVNNGSTGGTISTKTGTITIPEGYTTGGTVSISSTEQEKIVAGNIKEGVTILGVTGTASGGGTPVLQEKTVNPSTVQQEVTPDTGYDGLSKVTVNMARLQTKSITLTTNTETVEPDTGYYGLNGVNISASLQNKNVQPTDYQQVITADSGYCGLGSVTVAPSEVVEPTLQDKTVKSTDTQQTVTADTGYDGLGTITVSPMVLETKTVKSTDTEQTVIPTTGKDGISEITVDPIVLQNITVNPTALQQTISADTSLGYDALGTVTVNAKTVSLQNKTATPSGSLQTITADNGYDGLGTVTVNAINLQRKTVQLTEMNTTVEPSSEYSGLSSVFISAKTQAKTLTPSKNTQTVLPDTGYCGLFSVSVTGDQNLVPENIVSGVSIFGVTGTASGGTPNLQSKTVTLDSAQQTITADSGYDGLSSVIVPNSSLQNKTVTLTSSQQVIEADSGYYGLGQVTVPASSGGGGNDDKIISGNWGSDTTYTNNNVTEIYFGFPDNATFTNATRVGGYTFAGYAKVKNINLPACITFEQYAFYGNNHLRSVSAQLIQTVSANCFQNCVNLESVNFPSATRVNSNAFYGCQNSFTSASFPSTTYINSQAFQNCKKMTYANFPKADNIQGNAFNNCVLLDTIIIGTEVSTVCALSNTNAFANTPIASGTGYIYVKDELVNNYKEASNWSVYANQIKGISELV